MNGIVRWALVVTACHAPSISSTSTEPVPGDTGQTAPSGPTGDSGTLAPPTVRDRARELATFLRGDPDFMLGIGNDPSGPYDRDIPIDLHYAYLVGYGDQGGWPTWNPDGAYVTSFSATADAHDVTPMFTYYQLARELEGGNDAVLADRGRMTQYLDDVRLLFERLDDTGKPAVVGFEPDFFGFLMVRAAAGTGPDELVASFHNDRAPECDALPETASGLVRCVVAIGRAVAPSARIGLHASMWGAWYDVLDPGADIVGSGREVGAFLASVGAADTDFVAVETLDRDAGFWEAGGGGPDCSVTGGPRGAVYWDETNQRLPNFAQHLTWVAALTDELGLPALWWQTPLGVPSDRCGGSDQRWRDNRVHYFFSHVEELVEAGGAGMAFGTGAGGQTSVYTDGGQLEAAATAYMAAPHAL